SLGRAIDLAEFGGPVGLPGLAAVARVGLLPMGSAFSDVRPGEANLDGLAAQSIVGIESAHAVLEASPHRRVEVAGGIAAVEPPDGPDALLEFGVVHVAVAAHGDP